LLCFNIYEDGKSKPAGEEEEGRVPILLIEGPFPEDERARHTLAGVDVWCVRNGIFVIHTANTWITLTTLSDMLCIIRKF